MDLREISLGLVMLKTLPRPEHFGGRPKFWFGDRVYVTYPYCYSGTVYGVKLHPAKTYLWQYSILGDRCTEGTDTLPEYQLEKIGANNE